MTVVSIEFVDYGAQGEYGLFGKVVAKLDVTDMTVEESVRQVGIMQGILGGHVVTREVEEVLATCSAT